MSSTLLYSTQKHFQKVFLNFLKFLVSRIVPKNVKEHFGGFSTSILLQNRKKMKGGPFGDIKTIAKKAEKNLHKKNLVKGGTRTHVLPLGRLQKAVTSMPVWFSVGARQC